MGNAYNLEAFNRCFVIAKYISKFSFMHLYSHVICLITSSESPFISTFLAPKSLKIMRSVIRASYSASLLEHFPSTLHLNFVGISCGDNNKIPTRVPFFDLTRRSIRSKVLCRPC